MSTHITQEFDSITAVARYIKSTERAAGCNNASERNRAELDWDLGVGFDGAIAMAEEGGTWEEGAREMMEAHADLSSLKKEGRIPSEDYDVTGHTLDIGAYLGGQPDPYLNDGDEDVDSKPIIRIGVQVGRQSSVNSEHVVRRGAAILSVIDDLEDQGFRVEVTALWANHESVKYGSDVRVICKRAEDQWSPHSMAFALCHPAMNRRLMFRVAEADERLADLTHEGYGRGVDRDHPIAKEFDVFFGWQRERFRSVQQALEFVQNEVSQQLVGEESI